MLRPDDHAADVDGLLVELDEADAAVRALYHELAVDPDLVGEYEARLKELHAKRLDLAQRVGLASLARRRASAAAPAGLPEPTTTPAPDAAASSFRPVAEAEAPEGPPSQPASDAQLAHWKSTVRSTGLGVRLNGATSERTAWPLVLHELTSVVGAPRDLRASVSVIDETDALDEVSTEDQQARWARLPKNVQQLWLSMLAARCRALKELPSATSWAKVKDVLSRYPPWAKAHAPGHVNGMQVKHGPMRDSWSRDAVDYWSALADLLGDELAVRSPAATKKKAKPLGNDDDDGPEIDPAWRLLPLVQGRKGVIVGGDPRERSRERIERAFHLASLEWPSIDGPRKVDSVVERIGKGTYGLVLVLQPFVAHNESEPIIEAAKAVETPWALAEGYGVQSVKLALERFLGGPRP